MGSQSSSTEVDSKSRVSIGRFLLFLLTLWALAMIVPGLQRVIDSIGSFRLSIVIHGQAERADGIYHSLQPGDDHCERPESQQEQKKPPDADSTLAIYFR